MSLVVFAGFGAIIAKAVAGQREASGEVLIELCRQEGGAWKVIDRAKATATFNASVAELAGGKEARTDFTWNGISEKGRKLSVRWGAPAKFKFDPARGLLEANVTLDATVEGRKVSLPTKLTTDSFSSPIGQLSGKRATLSNGTLTAGLVGVANIKANDIIAILIGKKPAETPKAAGGKDDSRNSRLASGAAGSNEELVVVIKAGGRVTASV